MANEGGQIGSSMNTFQGNRKKRKKCFLMGCIYLPGHAKVSRRKQKKIFNLGPFSNSHLNTFS